MLGRILRNRFGGIFLFVLFFLAISFITRVALAVYSRNAIDHSILGLFKAFSVGAWRDLITAFYVAAPLVAWLTVCPSRLFRKKAHQFFLLAIASFLIFALIATSFGECFFWAEFGTRYNFIAKDYLIYTREIVGSINQSYPMPAVMPLAAVFGILVAWRLSRTKPWRIWMQSETRFRRRFVIGSLLLIFPLVSYAFISPRDNDTSPNSYSNELALNGINTFFSAITHDPIDYDHYFPTRPSAKIFKEIRQELNEPNTYFPPTEKETIVRQIITYPDKNEKRLNVIYIAVESLSAHFLSSFGNTHKLTPNLDKLAEESIFFTNIKATGTRTARGIESLTLAIPPTPGGSIIRQPHTEGMFTVGTEFRKRGYETKFIYGGFSDFDNMQTFFGGNGFTIIDRSNFILDEQSFGNMWGLCDEDLFEKELKEADNAFSSGKPFFHFLLTTSNHRPFTFPDGKIDLPPGTQNATAAYTDYAIGKFLEEARTKPWFDDTVFVIIADHGVRINQDQTTFPVGDYDIPLFIYSPKHFTPKKVNTLCSQMDTAPTLLGLLQWNYTSRFLGKNIFSIKEDEGRALLGSYEKLAMLRPDSLTILNALRTPECYRYENGNLTPIQLDDDLIEYAIMYYQAAGRLYKNGELWENPSLRIKRQQEAEQESFWSSKSIDE